MTSANKSYAIHIQHRPRRIAFLVDLEQGAVDDILLSILRFNLDSWGGRHNPVVPLIKGFILENFFPLLDVADPDIFYIYGELNPLCLTLLHARYAPTFVGKHTVRPPLEAHSYGVGLREQASIKGYLRSLSEKLGPYFRRPEPCLLELDNRESRTLSPFFLWNFGYSDALFFAIQNHEVPGCKPISAADHDLLVLLAKQLNLVWPINICGDAPLTRTTNDSYRNNFPIFFGTSPWNLIAYWNDGLNTGKTSAIHGGINQLWLTRKQIEEEATYKSLVRLLQLRVFSGNQAKRLKMISYDTDEQELQSIGQQIVKDVRGAFYFSESIKMAAPQTESVRPSRGTTLFSPRGEIDHANGKEIHLSLVAPPNIIENSDESWMVDVLISNPEQQLWYSNATPWWRLPRTPSLASLFTRSRPQRVVFDNRLSFEVASKDARLDLEIPSDAKLFGELLSPDLHYHLAADLRSTLERPVQSEVRLSDKGRYLSGILVLSGTLRDSLYFFEHPFWRSLLQRLSKPDPPQQLIDKLTSDAKKLLSNKGELDNATISFRLTHEVVLASRQLSRTPTWLTFSEIEELYAKYLSVIPSEEREWRSRNIRLDLSELTKDNIVFQGVELRCPKCISSYWYSVEEMHKAIVCRGCHERFPLPAEPQWSYQLNELIRAGISDHGLLPVIRTLTRLFDRATDCFFFTPSIEFLSHEQDGTPRIERELDLAWIKDGRFGIAEVKNTTKLFKRSDFEDLAEVANRTMPDVVLVAAPEGDQADLVRGAQAMKQKIPSTCEVWAWGPEEFKKSPSWTT